MCNASSISMVMESVLRRLLFLQLLTKRLQYAMTLMIHLELDLPSKVDGPIGRTCLSMQYSFFASMLFFVVIHVRGHSLWLLNRNDGPCHQSCEFFNLSAAKPRENKSAGFSADGTCRQVYPSVNCCISDIRFDTNVCSVFDCVCS